MLRLVSSNVERGYACRLEVARDEAPEDKVRIVWWSPAVLENGWEPFDQPSPAAYLPLDFKRLYREHVDGGGLVLVEKTSLTFSAQEMTFLLAHIGSIFLRAEAPSSALYAAMGLFSRTSGPHPSPAR